MDAKSYVENTLIKGEKIYYQGKVLPTYHLTMVPIVILLLSIMLMVGVLDMFRMAEGVGKLVALLMLLSPLLAFLQSWSVIISTEVAITDQRVITTTGLLTRLSSELSLDKVESVEVEQGILGRLLGYGTVCVNGTGGTCTPAPGIANPFEFRKIVQEAVNQRRGI